MGLPLPATMTGRVLDEALRNSRAQTPRKIDRTTATVKTPDGRYELIAHFSSVDGHQYLDCTDVKRTQ